MYTKQSLYKKWPAFSALSTFLLVGTVGARPMPAQNTPQDNDSRSVQDREDRRVGLARFDQFLDSHREIAEQLRKDPSLVNDKQFVKNHPDLQTWLQQNPEIHEDLTKNPTVYMRQENRYDNGENTAYRRAVADFDRFLDSHRQTAEQLRKNPSLVNDRQFQKDHPDLTAYLQDHPDVRDKLGQNPNAFMRQENWYDRHDNGSPTNDMDRSDRDRADRNNNTADRDNNARSDRTDNDRDDEARAVNRSNADRDDQARSTRTDNDADRDNRSRRDQDYDRRDNDMNRDTRDRDTTHRELASFDRFLDSHREAAEQLRKNPSLVDDREFVKNHPELQTYLQDHPQVREELKENPNAFMQQENRYDARENEARYNRSDNDIDARGRRDYDRPDNDMNRNDRDRDSAHSSFGAFLGGHSEIAHQLSKDPSLVKRPEYLRDHPELQQYLDAHPDVRQRLMADPQHFVKSAQEFNAKTPATTPTSPTAPPPKSKQ